MAHRLYCLLIVCFTIGLTNCAKPNEIHISSFTGTYQTKLDAEGKSAAPNSDPIQVPTGPTIEWKIKVQSESRRVQLLSQYGYSREATFEGNKFTLDTLRSGSDLNNQESSIGNGYFKGDSIRFTEIQTKKAAPYSYTLIYSYRGVRVK